jgi:hypothetical protein
VLLPVINSTVGEFEALLMKETLPVLLPLACGVKVKLSDMLWPAISVSGSDNPLTVYSELLEVAEEMVTLEPVAVRVAAKLVLLPTTTLPKSKLVGAKLN